MISSRPYHPQSQGKVERSHRELRNKMHYDMVKLSTKGVNWVENLNNYMRVLNEQAREELGWKSPFEIYYGRGSNYVKKICGGSFLVDNHPDYKPASPDMIKKRSAKTESLRKTAKKYGKKLDERMINKHTRKYTNQVYKKHQQVLVRISDKKKGKGAPKRRFVVEGEIVRKSTKSDSYKVNFVPPGQKVQKTEWFSVEDVTGGENTSKELSMNKRKKTHIKNFYLPLTLDDRVVTFQDQGYNVVYNPRGDGNCQFSALSNFLQSNGFENCTPRSLRQEVVQYLRDNPLNSEGQPLELFAGMAWDNYLSEMERNGVYGDQITLHGIAALYRMQITVVSTLGPDAQVTINEGERNRECVLGHFAEGNGEHYLNLERDFEPDTEEETNNVKVDFVVKPLLDWNQLPDEIWMRIIRFALQASDFTKENHVCTTFDSLCSLNDRFSRIMGSFKDQLPRVYCPKKNLLPKENNDVVTVSVMSLIRKFGSHSGLVEELKRVIPGTKWNMAWLELIAEKYSWFIIIRCFWKSTMYRR